MASIVKREKSYSVVYYQQGDPGDSKKQKWETFHSLQQAQERKEELENPIAFLGLAPHIRTLRELLDEYIRLHGKIRWSFSMYSGYTSLIKRYINPFIGEVKLTQINALLMSRFL